VFLLSLHVVVGLCKYVPALRAFQINIIATFNIERIEPILIYSVTAFQRFH
jgi:hypothetical protein